MYVYTICQKRALGPLELVMNSCKVPVYAGSSARETNGLKPLSDLSSSKGFFCLFLFLMWSHYVILGGLELVCKVNQDDL